MDLDKLAPKQSEIEKKGPEDSNPQGATVTAEAPLDNAKQDTDEASGGLFGFFKKKKHPTRVQAPPTATPNPTSSTETGSTPPLVEGAGAQVAEAPQAESNDGQRPQMLTEEVDDNGTQEGAATDALYPAPGESPEETGVAPKGATEDSLHAGGEPEADVAASSPIESSGSDDATPVETSGEAEVTADSPAVNPEPTVETTSSEDESSFQQATESADPSAETSQVGESSDAELPGVESSSPLSSENENAQPDETAEEDTSSQEAVASAHEEEAPVDTTETEEKHEEPDPEAHDGDETDELRIDTTAVNEADKSDQPKTGEDEPSSNEDNGYKVIEGVTNTDKSAQDILVRNSEGEQATLSEAERQPVEATKALDDYDNLLLRLLDAGVDLKQAENMRAEAKANPDRIPELMSMLDDINAISEDMVESYKKHDRNKSLDEVKADTTQDFLDDLDKDGSETSKVDAALLKLYNDTVNSKVDA